MTDLVPHKRESPTQSKRAVHPAALAFPEMSPAALQKLAEDIRQNCQAHPIMRTADGIILDGRNRLKACEIAGVEPWFETYEGGNPVGFIVSSNLQRHQLNESQRALIATRLATLFPGQHQAAGENAERSGPSVRNQGRHQRPPEPNPQSTSAQSVQRSVASRNRRPPAMRTNYATALANFGALSMRPSMTGTAPTPLSVDAAVRRCEAYPRRDAILESTVRPLAKSPRRQ
jgi:hypothetical protein